MNFSDLTGYFIFQGIKRDIVKIGSWYDENESVEANRILFKLSGIVYEAVENPDDGWRSFMELTKSDMEMENQFKIPVKAFSMGEAIDKSGYYENNDVLILEDIHTRKTILEIGTKNYDDYYPYTHFKYMPENSYLNIGGTNNAH